MRLADTKANRAAFPPSANLPAGTGFPYLRCAVLFCVRSGALLARAVGSLKNSEFHLWQRLLEAIPPGVVVLGDRLYGQYVVAALLQSQGAEHLT